MEKPIRMTARGPEDLLAMVPCVLGFHPENSMVMLTFGADSGDGAGFQARVDLPPDASEVPAMVEALAAPARHHGIRRAVLLLYCPDGPPARLRVGEQALLALHDALDEADIDVLEMLRANGRRWFPMRPGSPRAPRHGIPYDAQSHPFVAQSVLAGQVTHGSRAELAATLAPVPDAGEHRLAGLVQHHLDELPERQLAAERRWVDRAVRDATARPAGAAGPDDEVAARLLAACTDLVLRDVAWAVMERAGADRHVELWRDLVRRAPVAVRAAPAGLLAFAAWLAGQGALAWCAVDRCREADPEHSMVTTMTMLLERAVSPEEWADLREGLLAGLEDRAQ